MLHQPTEQRPGEGVSLLRIAAVKARTGLSRSAIYALMQKGEFPAPHHIAGTRVSVWPSTAVDRWIADQLADEM